MSFDSLTQIQKRRPVQTTRTDDQCNFSVTSPFIPACRPGNCNCTSIQVLVSQKAPFYSNMPPCLFTQSTFFLSPMSSNMTLLEDDYPRHLVELQEKGLPMVRRSCCAPTHFCLPPPGEAPMLRRLSSNSLYPSLLTSDMFLRPSEDPLRVILT